VARLEIPRLNITVGAVQWRSGRVSNMAWRFLGFLLAPRCGLELAKA